MIKAQCPICRTILTVEGDFADCPGCGRRLALPASLRPTAALPTAPPPPPQPPYTQEAPRSVPSYRDEEDDVPVGELIREPEAAGDEFEAAEAERASRPKRRRLGRRDPVAFAKARQTTALLLFLIAGLQTICGAILLNGNNPAIPPEARDVVFVILVATVFTYVGLGFWALLQPVPAALIGLVIYVLLAAADVVAAPLILANPFFYLRVAVAFGLLKCLTSLYNAS